MAEDPVNPDPDPGGSTDVPASSSDDMNAAGIGTIGMSGLQAFESYGGAFPGSPALSGVSEFVQEAAVTPGFSPIGPGPAGFVDAAGKSWEAAAGLTGFMNGFGEFAGKPGFRAASELLGDVFGKATPAFVAADIVAATIQTGVLYGFDSPKVGATAASKTVGNTLSTLGGYGAFAFGAAFSQPVGWSLAGAAAFGIGISFGYEAWAAPVVEPAIEAALEKNIKDQISRYLDASTSGIGTQGWNNHFNPSPMGWGYLPPVVLDLDGDGVEINPLNNAPAFVDLDKDGYSNRVAWVGKDDGLLVVDSNNDGKITLTREFAFAGLTEKEDTDLEALRSLYDSNKDGKISTADAGYQNIKVWRDADGDTLTDPGELKTLASHGITSIGLNRTKSGMTLFDGSVIHGYSTYTTSTGKKLDVADVALRLADDERRIVATSSGFAVLEDGAPSSNYLINSGSQSQSIELSGADVAGVLGGSGDDTFDALQGGADIDWMDGGEGNDLLHGGAGNDILLGGGGDDRLFGEDGKDLFYGGAGRDLLEGAAGDDEMRGEAGDDTLNGASGDDILDGGEGNDALNAGDGRDALLGWGGNDTLWGGAGKDGLVGGEGDDALCGGLDDDTLKGNQGADLLVGEDGNDLLMGGLDGDTLLGGLGDDDLYGDEGDDSLDGGAGADTMWGGHDNDTLLGAEGNDVLDGGIGNDSVVGGLGDDMLRGDAGNDSLDGGGGNDQLFGNDGNDIMIGGPDVDYIDGGKGTDTIVFSGRRMDYEIRFNTAIGRYSIVDLRTGSPDGTDLADIEIFSFSDGQFTQATINYITDTASQVAWNIDNSDGSRSILGWLVSATDPSQWDAYVRHFNLAGVKMSETVIKQDGSRIAYAWDADSNQTWASYIQTYDTEARLIAHEYLNDDGTSSIEERDYTGNTDWLKRVTTYDAAKPRRPVLQEDTIRSGRLGLVESIERGWDYSTTVTWADYTIKRDAALRTLWQEKNHDDGSRTVDGWDYEDPTAPQPWKEFHQQFNSGKQQTYDYYLYYSPVQGKFSSIEKQWDYSTAIAWRYKELHIDYLSRKTYEQHIFDNETQTIWQWDYSTTTWTYRETRKSAAGTEIWQWDQYEASEHILRLWDDGTAPWNKQEQKYNKAGIIYRDQTDYDSGKQVLHEWDRDGKETWEEKITTRNNGVDRSEEKIVYTSTRTTVETWDETGKEDWTSHVEEYLNGNAKPTTDIFYKLAEKIKELGWDREGSEKWDHYEKRFDDKKVIYHKTVFDDDTYTIDQTDYAGEDWDTIKVSGRKYGTGAKAYYTITAYDKGPVTEQRTYEDPGDITYWEKFSWGFKGNIVMYALTTFDGGPTVEHVPVEILLNPDGWTGLALFAPTLSSAKGMTWQELLAFDLNGDGGIDLDTEMPHARAFLESRLAKEGYLVQ